MKIEHQRTLVLNSNGSPMGIISWKRAVTMSVLNQESQDQGLVVLTYFQDDHILGASGRKYPIPAVVMCPRYVRRKDKGVPFSRKNVYLRDQMTCQYCGKTDSTARELTYDHVIPRSTWNKKGYNGTPTNWTNIVACCDPCNKSKADRTPKQAGMKLLRQPVQPNSQQYILGLSRWCIIPEEWEPFITPLYKHLGPGP